MTEEWGGRYTPEAQQAMMGMSSASGRATSTSGRAPRTAGGDQRGSRAPDDRALRDRAAGRARCRRGGPALADAALRLALASSSNRELIDAVLRGLELTELFEVTVSSEEVARGKPAPDVYLEAAGDWGRAARCVAVEDSASGIRAAHAAGMRVVAYPNRRYPPSADMYSRRPRHLVTGRARRGCRRQL